MATIRGKKTTKYYKKVFKITASQQAMLKEFCVRHQLTEKKFFRNILNDYLTKEEKDAQHLMNFPQVAKNQLNLLDLIEVVQKENKNKTPIQGKLF